jgi:hypothetical protein
MTTEPQRRIEKWLLAYARRRQDAAGPPLALSAPQRRLLQAEVSRAYRGESPAVHSWRSLLFRCWPQFAGVSAFIVLALLLVMQGLQPPVSPPVPLRSTKNDEPSTIISPSLLNAPETGPAVRRFAESQPAAASDQLAARPTGQPYGLKSVDGTGSGEPLVIGQSSEVIPFPNTAPARAPEPPSQFNLAAARARVAAEDLAANSPAPAAPLTALKTAPSPANSFHFIRNTSTDSDHAGNPPPGSAKVLSSFTMERTGNQVRLVDEDGSVYQGEIRTPTPAPTASPVAAARKMPSKPLEYSKAAGNAAAAPASLPPNTLLVRAAGLNRSLNQPIEFQGTYTPGINGTYAYGRATMASPGRPGGQTEEAGTLQGQVLIGGSNHLTISARQQARP